MRDPHPNPFEVLGLDPTARDVEIRRQYLRRIHRVDPDESPGDFLELRRALHEALRRAPGNRVACGEPAHDLPGDAALGPLLEGMDRALARHDCSAALEIASRGIWHDALLRDDELVIEATIRLACAAVWTSPDVYEQIWLQHADVLQAHGAQHCAGVLPFMHDLASELSAWSTLRQPAAWLAAFLEAGIVPSARHRRVARTLAGILRDKPEQVLRELDRVQGYLPSLVAFVGHVARELPYELGRPVEVEQRAEDHAQELRRAFPVIRPTLVVAAVGTAAVLSRRVRAPLLAGAGASALFGPPLMAEWYRLVVRPRLLKACLRYDVAPFDLGNWAREQPRWSRARPLGELLASDGVLQAAYDLDRFARAAQ